MTSLNSKKLTPEKIREAHEYYPSLWVKGMVNESGFPIEFTDHRFLIDIYNDLSPFQVILKPPQIGATVMNVLKALYVASHYDKQIIYTLPTATDMYEMVGSGFNRIIAQNPELQELVRNSDTMDHKAVGDGLIRFRGTFSSKQAMMVPSDLNIHDEVDASDPAVITQYETRLQAKADGWRWYFSHPSLVGKGVDVYWQQSDKKEWFITCSNCTHEQILSWPESVNLDTTQYQCIHCKSPLDDNARRMGTWRPTASGLFSGYHISQLMCPWISAEKIIEASRDPLKDQQYFYNYVLGLPYASSSDIITKEEVLENVTSEFNDQTGTVVIGVDPGLPMYYVLGNSKGIFHFDHCELPSADYDPYKHIESLLLRFPKSIIISDQGGEFSGMRQLQDKYPGRVYLCFYRKDRKTKQLIKWGNDDERGTVIVDRNRMLSLIVEQFKKKNMKLNGTKEEFTPLAEHFANMYREVKDTNYGPEYEWIRRGPDHWAHSLLYCMVGLERFGEQENLNITPAWMKQFKTGIDLTTITANDLRKLYNFN